MYLLRQRNKASDEKEKQYKEKDRRISLLKTLILDYNLRFFYEAFENIEEELKKLKDKNCNKKELEPALQRLFNQLFEKFINFISAVDSGLYEQLKDSCDHCRDTLICNIADPGVNLWVDSQYKDKIKDIVEKDKRKMISLLFSYDGTI